MQECPLTSAPRAREELWHSARPIRHAGEALCARGGWRIPAAFLDAPGTSPPFDRVVGVVAGGAPQRSRAYAVHGLAGDTHGAALFVAAQRSFAPSRARPDFALPPTPTPPGATKSVMGVAPTTPRSCGCLMATAASAKFSSASMCQLKQRRLLRRWMARPATRCMHWQQCHSTQPYQPAPR